MGAFCGDFTISPGKPLRNFQCLRVLSERVVQISTPSSTAWWSRASTCVYRIAVKPYPTASSTHQHLPSFTSPVRSSILASPPASHNFIQPSHDLFTPGRLQRLCAPTHILELPRRGPRRLLHTARRTTRLSTRSRRRCRSKSTATLRPSQVPVRLVRSFWLRPRVLSLTSLQAR